MGHKKTRKIVYMALLSAVAIVLHMVETMLQLPLPLGMKLGLANIISLVVIEIYGAKEMFVVNFLRVMISSLMTGIFLSPGFFISCGGVLLSSVALVVVKKFTQLPIVSTSILAAVFHNIGQILVVSFMYANVAIMSYIFILLASSIPTGIFTGLTSIEITKRIHKEKIS